MADASSIRWKFLKDTVRDQVIAILGSDIEDAIWQDSNAPRPERPYVSMRVIAGPRRITGVIDDVEESREAPVSYLVEVLSTAAGRRNRLRLNGRPFDRIATAAGEEDATRDLWVADITASDEPVTAAATASPGELLLTPNFPGAIYSLVVTPTAASLVTPNATLVSVLDHWGTRLFTISFAVWTKSTKYQDDATDGPGALDLASRIESGFERETIKQALHNRRIRLWGPVGDAANLTALASAFNEGRGQVDLVFAATSLQTEPIDTIEFVNLDIQGQVSQVDLTP